MARGAGVPLTRSQNAAMAAKTSSARSAMVSLHWYSSYPRSTVTSPTFADARRGAMTAPMDPPSPVIQWSPRPTVASASGRALAPTRVREAMRCGAEWISPCRSCGARAQKCAAWTPSRSRSSSNRLARGIPRDTSAICSAGLQVLFARTPSLADAIVPRADQQDGLLELADDVIGDAAVPPAVEAAAAVGCEDHQIMPLGRPLCHESRVSDVDRRPRLHAATLETPSRAVEIRLRGAPVARVGDRSKQRHGSKRRPRQAAREGERPLPESRAIEHDEGVLQSR